MFKKISVFLVLVLVIGALSACAGSMPKLSEEKKAEIEDAWYAQYEWHWVDDPNGGFCRYYGNYEGYDIIFVISGPLDSMWADVVDTKVIAGIEFYSGMPCSLYGYRNGKIYEVHELYNSGELSAESIAAAAEIHNTGGKTLYLSEQEKEAMRRAWAVERHGLLWNSEEKQTDAIRYYGTFDGYDIVYCIHGVSQYNDDGRTISIDGILIEYDCDSNIFGFQDGEYDFIAGLYEEGKLSRESIAEIAKIHQRSERKEAN